MPPEPAKPLRIFLSYAHADVAAVRKLHRYLCDKGFDVWFDRESLVPGQDWQLEIERGLNHSDVILVCLSQAAVSAEGFVQREFRFALDRALEMPEGRIFLIPVRLQPCEAPTRLNRYHWVDLFEREGYQRLMRGLKHCAEQLARARVDESQPVNIPDPDRSAAEILNDLSVVGDGNVVQTGGSDALKNEQAEKRAVEQAEAEKQARQKAEQGRVAGEKAEAEKIAQEKLEQERVAREEAEQGRIAAEEAEKERLAKIKAENERVAREQAEQERIARQKADVERIAKQKAENENKAREKAERDQRAKLAHTNIWTGPKILGGLLLVGVGCVAIWLLGQALFPARAIPTATLEVLTTATTPPATFIPVLPTNTAYTSIIASAKMVTDTIGIAETTSFTPDQTFYVFVELANAPDTTKVKAVWYSVDDAGVATQLVQKEIVGSGSPITFNASNNAGPWPVGKYKVELYLNDKLDTTLGFTVAITSSSSLTPMLAAGDVKVSEKDGMKLHYVPAGPFTMGGDTYYINEKPIHTVTLSAFWIDETEVTNKMYALCVKDTKCQSPGNKSSSKRPNYYDDTQYADYPVIYVSWNDATAYCSWAGRALPSEAQWEKAARSPNGNTYPWGNDAPNKDLLNYNADDTTKVGHYPNGKSFYGAQDMAGNVSEWVNDWYSGTYYASSLSTDPPGPVSGQYRVRRGGAWDDGDNGVRSAYRNINYPDNRGSNVGFRCALVQ